MSFKTDSATARTIGIDTGKYTLHMIGLDEKGTIVLREKIARGRIGARLVNVPQCLIGIEAGMATHYVARELTALGHDVKQVPPAYSKRLPGCLRSRRSRAASLDTLCSSKNRQPTRSTGAPSRSVSPHQRSYSCDQPNPQFSS
jgi:transposase